MEHLRGPLYWDVTGKGLCLVGVMLMIFGQGGWFTVGVFTVFIGALAGGWSMVAARHVRQRGWDGRNRV